MSDEQLDRISKQLDNAQGHATGMMWNRALDGMSGPGAIIAMIVLILYSPFWLLGKITKHYDKEKAIREEKEKCKREKLDQLAREEDVRAYSVECAMKILEQIKKEDYNSEDPFYAPITEGWLTKLNEKELLDLKNIMEGRMGRSLRGALRYLLSLPENEAKEEMIEASTEIASKAYLKQVGKEDWEGLPKGMKAKIRQRIKEEEYDLTEEEKK